MSTGNDKNDDKPVRAGFGLGGLAKSLREQADQIGKSAKDAVNKAQVNAESLAAKVEQSTVSGTKGGGEDNKHSNTPVGLLGINNSGLDYSPGMGGHNGDSESNTELAGAKSRFGSVVGLHSTGGGVGEPREANDRSAPGPEAQLGASLSSRTPEEVSKEELLDILQKMNKRVKALSALRGTLTERVKSSEKDRSRLIDFLKEEVLTRVDVEEASVAAAEKNTKIAAKQAEGSDENDGSGRRKIDEVGMLQMAWRAADERNALSLQAIQSECKNLTIQHQSELEKIRNTMKNEIDAHAADPERDGNESSNTEIELRRRIHELSSSHQAEMESVRQQHQDEMLRIREEVKGDFHDTKEESLEHISKEEYESRLKEAKLETTKQVKDAYENKLRAIKEKAKAFVEKTKKDAAEQIAAANKEAKDAVIKLGEAEKQISSGTASQRIHAEQELDNIKAQAEAAAAAEKEIETQRETHETALKSLQEQHKTEMDALQSKCSEGVASVGREKDEEVLGLRERVTELEGALQASREDASGQLDQMKQELADTSSLLEESKRSEAATSAELDNIKAQAEAAAAAEKEIETQREAHETALKSLQEQHKTEMDALQSKCSEGVASVGREKDEEVLGLRERVTELEGALQASREDASGQLDQMKQELTDTSSLLEESKRSEAATSAELDNIKAQAEAAAAAEKEIETQREAHETALKSLQEQHKTEMDALQSKYSEGVASVGREKDEEVLGLRERVTELEGALQASREDASGQLDQMKQELTDTSSLLEESKRSEAATSAELDNIKAQAQAEAAAAAEKEIETQREAHETALKSLQEQHKTEMDALQSKCSEGVASVGREKDEEVLGLRERVAELEWALQASKEGDSKQSSDSAERVRELEQALQEERSSRRKNDVEFAAQKQLIDSLRTEHLAEMNSIRDETSAKLNAAMQKHAKAMEYVKKLKVATAEKLKTISEERVAERDKLELDKSELVNDLVQKHADDLIRARDSERTHWEEIVSDLKSKIFSFEEKLQGEHVLEERSKEAEQERNRAIEILKEKKEESEKELKAQQLAAIEAAKQEKQMEFDRMKSDLEAKLESLVVEHSKAKAELEERMAKHADELKIFYEGKMNSALTQAKSDLNQKEDEVSQLLLQVKSSEEAVTQLRENNEALQLQAQEHSDVHKALKQRIDELREEISINAANSSATAQSLVKEQEVLQEDAKTLKNRISVLSEEKESDSKAIGAFRVEVDSLSGQVEGLLREKEVFGEKLNEAARKENKLLVAETELSALREEVNKLKLNESKSTSLVTRLQSEKEASQRKHGQQTALIGMLEAQLGELNESSSDSKAKLEAALYDIGQRDENIVSLRDQLEKSEREVAQLASRKAQSDSFAQHAADKEAVKKAKMIEALQKELQVLQHQMARKSAAAQRLLQERENECNELRRTNKVLQNEVDKGSLSDRRIFELAAQQSSRESVAAAEIELRDKLVQRLAEKLEGRDSDLAAAEYTVQRVEGQVEELCRVRRREDVNLDYLKSIVVQYLSKPPGSSERAALLPVLATLLQFDASDYEAIEAGKANLSWWGSIVPKDIAPRTPSLSLSANPPPPAPSPAKPRPTRMEF